MIYAFLIAAALALSGCVSAGYMNRRLIEQELRDKDKLVQCLGSLESEMRLNDTINQDIKDGKYRSPCAPLDAPALTPGDTIYRGTDFWDPTRTETK